MKQINPYLNFLGNTEEAFNFYKSIFGGDFSSFVRFKDAPGAGPVPEKEANGLMHVSLPAGNTTLMATDTLESMGHTLTVGNNINLCVVAESREEADKIFSKLAAGGKVSMPIADMFWGSYWGSVTDKFGVNWMVDYNAQQQ